MRTHLAPARDGSIPHRNLGGPTLLVKLACQTHPALTARALSVPKPAAAHPIPSCSRAIGTPGSFSRADDDRRRRKSRCHGRSADLADRPSASALCVAGCPPCRTTLPALWTPDADQAARPRPFCSGSRRVHRNAGPTRELKIKFFQKGLGGIAGSNAKTTRTVSSNSGEAEHSPVLLIRR
jgi:hypothetical protein